MASKIINLGNQNQKSLVPCNDVSPIPDVTHLEQPTPCTPDHAVEKSWLQNIGNTKVGLGQALKTDPMITGQIINDPDSPNRNTIYRYSKAIRGCDEAVMDIFRNMVVIDEDGKAWAVPIIWATQEKAVAAILQDNVRKDNSLVVDRLKLPMLAIYANAYQFNQDRYVYHQAIDYLRREKDNKPGFTTSEVYERDTVFGVARGIPIDITYTLYAWTLYMEDMDQLLEQIIQKTSPVAYIKVRGVQWETIVKMESIANNLDVEPGDQNIRVIKFEFNLTAQTYIPQPIIRRKAVLKTKMDFYEMDEQKRLETIERLEEVVEEMKNDSDN